jgi:1-acylglycerone phosphate reductase
MGGLTQEPHSGRTHTIPAVDMELDDVRQTYETNVFGPMLTIQGFIGLLIPARGLIINISSASANFPYLFGAIYSSTKGALDVYSRALRVELKPLGVRVMVASTGTVRSNIASRQHRSLPPGSLYEPIRDVFERRLVFSQNNGTVATDVYAANLVTQALKGEGWLGGWLGGTPNWYTTGGLSTLVWALTCIPRWMTDAIANVYWGVPSMTQRIQAARQKQA